MPIVGRAIEVPIDLQSPEPEATTSRSRAYNEMQWISGQAIAQCHGPRLVDS